MEKRSDKITDQRGWEREREKKKILRKRVGGLFLNSVVKDTFLKASRATNLLT